MLTKTKEGYSINLLIPYTESSKDFKPIDVNDLLDSFTEAIEKAINEVIKSQEVAIISSQSIEVASENEIIYTDDNNRVHRVDTDKLYNMYLTSRKLSSTMFEDLNINDLEAILLAAPKLEDNKKYSVLELQNVVIYQLKALCQRM